MENTFGVCHFELTRAIEGGHLSLANQMCKSGPFPPWLLDESLDMSVWLSLSQLQGLPTLLIKMYMARMRSATLASTSVEREGRDAQNAFQLLSRSGNLTDEAAAKIYVNNGLNLLRRTCLDFFVDNLKMSIRDGGEFTYKQQKQSHKIQLLKEYEAWSALWSSCPSKSTLEEEKCKLNGKAMTLSTLTGVLTTSVVLTPLMRGSTKVEDYVSTFPCCSEDDVVPKLLSPSLPNMLHSSPGEQQMKRSTHILV